MATWFGSPRVLLTGSSWPAAAKTSPSSSCPGVQGCAQLHPRQVASCSHLPRLKEGSWDGWRNKGLGSLPCFKPCPGPWVRDSSQAVSLPFLHSYLNMRMLPKCLGHGGDSLRAPGQEAGEALPIRASEITHSLPAENRAWVLPGRSCWVQKCHAADGAVTLELPAQHSPGCSQSCAPLPGLHPGLGLSLLQFLSQTLLL